jgi:hypothetical protein
MFPIQAFNRAQLEGMTAPAAIPGGNMEAYPKIYYDTQTYTAAGALTSLEFFSGTNADKSLSNMEAPGQLPDPKYFRIFWLQCHVLLPVAAAAVPTQWRDLSSIVDTRRPTFELSVQDKPYGRIPLVNMPSPGGIIGNGYADAAVAGVLDHEYANNGAPTGGFWVGGTITLKPKVNFVGVIRWGGATAAVLADTLIRIQMVGVEYRAIV